MKNTLQIKWKRNKIYSIHSHIHTDTYNLRIAVESLVISEEEKYNFVRHDMKKQLVLQN